MSSPIPQTPRAKRHVDGDLDNVLPEYSTSTNNAQKGDTVGAATPTLPDPRTLQRFSASHCPQNGRHLPRTSFGDSSPAPGPGGIRDFCLSAWQKNAGPILIILSQLFGALMNFTCRLLELEDGLHPMQILCARMTATIIVCFSYMYFQKIPTAPWGSPEIRPLLILRSFSGFAGLYGMWYSIMYLPLAEATVISFLAPNLAGYLCRVFLKEPFTRREQMGSFVALVGIVLITRPISLFSGSAVDVETAGGNGIDYVPTAAERLHGIGMGLLGVVGSAITIVVLRCIGPRVHPLISVNYFSLFCSIITVLTLSLAPMLDYNQPALRFVLPSSAKQCLLLIMVGLCGFGTQFLLTAGLARERSNRATGMIYTNVLFAAGFDRFVFGTRMSWLSVAGCGLVVGSALWVALSKREEGTGKLQDAERRGAAIGGSAGAVGEDVAMLTDVGDEMVEL
ncbi:integral membrane protein DUF6 [Xylariales sp. AK1849]|nr:integral membrane protein DUF6 [Xylariales sp. AK1849]